MERNRLFVLGGLLLVLSAAAALVLANVLQVVFFAVTVAYVLYPLRQWIRQRGAPRRVASAVATTIGFLIVVAVAGPLVYIIYRRRTQLVAVVNRIPDTLEFTVGGADLFTLLVYGMLYKPSAIRAAVYKLVPDRYHDIVTCLHERTRTTLYSIYVLQAATALGTFAIALPLFVAFGYSASFTLAVISGILQFIPIFGPSVLILFLAANEVLLGDLYQAVSLVVVGLVFIGFVPDAIIRTQLAGYTGKLPTSLYFVGFVGGILTVGAIGLIAGPLVVAGCRPHRREPQRDRRLRRRLITAGRAGVRGRCCPSPGCRSPVRASVPSPARRSSRSRTRV
ncbi:MAG: AI-2E family transporter [Halobacteriales archaeon SW_8_66_22]|nr:MAG: AI-2E family transporter [Halobacteriales archaeon SW_8_66_22]